MLALPGNKEVRSINPLVAETNDGVLNDIRGRHVRKEHALAAIAAASEQVAEGCVGAGTGTICFGLKGGIGTASRILPAALGGYAVGVLVQTNFGGVLQIAGAPVGRMLGKLPFDDALAGGSADGSCMIIVATDAPLDGRNLERLAKRAFMGLARTGGIASNGSGDYVIAFSTVDALRIPHSPPRSASLQRVELLHDDCVSPLFLAAIEATEEAIVNSLFTAVTTTGFNGALAEALPVERVLACLPRTS
jgi:D-aminopeptidase